MSDVFAIGDLVYRKGRKRSIARVTRLYTRDGEERAEIAWLATKVLNNNGLRASYCPISDLRHAPEEEHHP